MDEYKQDYLNLHCDLTAAEANFRSALRELTIAEAYICAERPNTNTRPIELDAVTRTSLSTALAIVIPVLTRLIDITTQAKHPCERRYPELIGGQGRLQ